MVHLGVWVAFGGFDLAIEETAVSQLGGDDGAVDKGDILQGASIDDGSFEVKAVERFRAVDLLGWEERFFSGSASRSRASRRSESQAANLKAGFCASMASKSNT